MAGIGVAVLATSRSTLALVVSICRLNDAVSASPAPCLAVHAPRDERGGYAVLREPIRKRRMVLSPLADITGIEDPQLLSGEAPNFFAEAWRERYRLFGGNPAIDPWRDVALALNSKDNRSQDHLHIHIACIRPSVRNALERDRAAIPAGRFVRLAERLRHRLYWASRIETDSLERLNPVRFVAENLPAGTDIGGLAIVVIGAVSADGRRGFYILVGERDDREDSPASTARLLDPTCALRHDDRAPTTGS